MSELLYKRLLTIFWAMLAGVVCLLAVCFFFFDGKGLIGSQASTATMEMVFSTVAILATLGGIPYTLKRVSNQQLRIVIIGTLTEISSLGYLLFGTDSFLYLSFINIVAMIFVYPKKTQE